MTKSKKLIAILRKILNASEVTNNASTIVCYVFYNHDLRPSPYNKNLSLEHYIIYLSLFGVV